VSVSVICISKNGYEFYYVLKFFDQFQANNDVFVVNLKISSTFFVVIAGRIPLTLLFNAISFSCKWIEVEVGFSSRVVCIKPPYSIRYDKINAINSLHRSCYFKEDLSLVNFIWVCFLCWGVFYYIHHTPWRWWL